MGKLKALEEVNGTLAFVFLILFMGDRVEGYKKGGAATELKRCSTQETQSRRR